MINRVDPRPRLIGFSNGMILFCAEKLRRIDDLITSKLAEKQQIICNMFRVPMEDFNTIVDIASQPEAPQVSVCVEIIVCL